MIKSRIVQLVYLGAFCALAMIGVLGSLGLFDADYNDGFYVFFTNLSNYFCMGVMFAELVEVIKKANKNEDGFITISPLLKFIGLVMILVTFLVYNIILAKNRTIEFNLSIRSVLLHIVLPIMYVLDWILFYERKQVKWYYPLYTLIAPAIYAVYVFVRAWIVGLNGLYPYPYFFLDPTVVRTSGVIMWLGILLAIFLGLGYLFYGLDKIKRKQKIEEVEKEVK